MVHVLHLVHYIRSFRAEKRFSCLAAVFMLFNLFFVGTKQ